jgi:hypothetical protein
MEKFQLAYKYTDILKNQRINFDFISHIALKVRFLPLLRDKNQ